MQKKIKGIINCSINKRNIFKNKNLGVTEYLALKNKIKKSEVMVIYNKEISVVPLTTHIKLKDVPKNIKKDILIKKIRTLYKDYKKYFNKYPRIAVLGLNPHNFELKRKSEEVQIIMPVIKRLKKIIKFLVLFPLTLFFRENLKKFDVIIGMYHDQVLAL